MQALSEDVCLSEGGILSIEILCITENTYYPIEVAPETALYQRTRKRNKEGTLLIHKLGFSLNSGRQDLEDWLQDYAERFFLVKITTFQYQIYTIGTTDFPSEFLEEYNTGKKTADTNEYQFNFTANVPI